MTATTPNDLPTQWANAWSQPNTQPWTALYAPSATYTDHAFRITRTGHDLLARHHKIWRTANPDFTLTVDTTRPVWWNGDDARQNGRYSFRTVNRGTFEKDLPSRKASGRKWEFSAVVDLVVKSGLVVKVDEWYTVEFDRSVPVAEYT